MTISRAAIDAELDKIFAVIGAAYRLMGEERLVDLSVLDRRIQQMCEAVRDLGGDEARVLKPKLEVLVEKLDELGAAMNTRYGELPIMPSHSVSNAAAAYANMLKHFP